MGNSKKYKEINYFQTLLFSLLNFFVKFNLSFLIIEDSILRQKNLLVIISIFKNKAVRYFKNFKLIYYI
jgi:hypothetical protein